MEANDEKVQDEQHNDETDETQLRWAAYLNAAFNGWVQTSLERDKSILTISAGAIGLLITLLNVYGPASEMELLVYLTAILFFVIAILCAVFIFGRNKIYLEEVIKNNSPSDGHLAALDKVIIYSFMTGIVFSAIIGANAGIIQLKKRSVKHDIQPDVQFQSSQSYCCNKERQACDCKCGWIREPCASQTKTKRPQKAKVECGETANQTKEIKKCIQWEGDKSQ